MLVTISVFLAVLLSIGCAPERVKYHPQVPASKKIVTSWVNEQYLDCMKRSLPCECERHVNGDLMIFLDSTVSNKNIGVWMKASKEVELDYWETYNSLHDTLQVQVNAGSDYYKKRKIVFDSDTLYLIDSTKSRKGTRFIRNINLSDVYDNGKINVILLNKELSARNYPSLETIVEKDSLQCDCNKWIGGVNLLAASGVTNKWILERTVDSLIIFEKVNHTEGKRVPPRIVKREFLKLKW
jgi:hypothetical protein